MKKILLLLFLSSASLAYGQITETIFAQRTFSDSANFDTTFIFFPGAAGSASVRFDTSAFEAIDATLLPTKTANSPIKSFFTYRRAGVAANADSTWLKVKPIVRVKSSTLKLDTWKVSHNDSVNVTGTALTSTIYNTTRLFSYDISGIAADNCIGIAVIQAFGGVVTNPRDGAVTVIYSVGLSPVKATIF